MGYKHRVISIVTPTYRTPPDVLARTWGTLKAQTHTDWEWVVWDDTPDDATVWRQLYGLASDERFRLIAHRSHVHSGVIGAVKRRAFMAAEGDILVELDHDDELHPRALEAVAEAFDAHPDAGFVYSDWSEIFADGSSGRYPEGWAFGYGGDYLVDGTWVMSAPAINRTTMSHIVSVPNHIRAWRADFYRALGGHDPSLHVADDYELIIRTFLAGPMVHIPVCLYRQHIGGHTTQRQRNADIQSLVAELSSMHSAALDARAQELGGGEQLAREYVPGWAPAHDPVPAGS